MGEIRYQEFGAPGARVGCLSFEFYNGAMSTSQCRRLLAAWREATARDTRVLLIAGGADFFSNGIHLNCIEAASYREDDSAADESMRNIEAMDDLAEAVIRTTDRLTIALLRGNAGAGGAFLALAADEVWAHRGVVLNPHYKNMGNLYGSEYWTYLLPRRLGDEGAAALMAGRLPLGAPQACRSDSSTGAWMWRQRRSRRWQSPMRRRWPRRTISSKGSPQRRGGAAPTRPRALSPTTAFMSFHACIAISTASTRAFMSRAITSSTSCRWRGRRVTSPGTATA